MSLGKLLRDTALRYHTIKFLPTHELQKLAMERFEDTSWTYHETIQKLSEAKLQLDLVMRSLVEQNEAEPEVDSNIKAKLDLIQDICTSVATALPSFAQEQKTRTLRRKAG